MYVIEILFPHMLRLEVYFDDAYDMAIWRYMLFIRCDVFEYNFMHVNLSIAQDVTSIS